MVDREERVEENWRSMKDRNDGTQKGSRWKIESVESKRKKDERERKENQEDEGGQEGCKK